MNNKNIHIGQASIDDTNKVLEYFSSMNKKTITNFNTKVRGGAL